MSAPNLFPMATKLIFFNILCPIPGQGEQQLPTSPLTSPTIPTYPIPPVSAPLPDSLAFWLVPWARLTYPTPVPNLIGGYCDPVLPGRAPARALVCANEWCLVMMDANCPSSGVPRVLVLQSDPQKVLKFLFPNY